MLRIDGRPVPRLFVEAGLAGGHAVPLAEAQHHYLARVMRLKQGDAITLFNGRDGEWLGLLDKDGVAVQRCLRDQGREPDIWLVFAPMKKERQRFLVEKATELGVSALVPAVTEHTSAPALRQDKLRDWAIEAAEQCGRLSVPDCAPPQAMAAILEAWDEARCLVLCDETGGGKPAMEVFARGAQAPAALLIGPEGGFSDRERDLIAQVPVSVSVGLGPRILRAETAATVALACWQAAQGDARLNPAVAQDMKLP